MVADAAATWALAKVVKRIVQRGRPAALVPGTHVRGKEATGFGYLSGHAGVATALMVAAAAAIPRRRRFFAGGASRKPSHWAAGIAIIMPRYVAATSSAR